MRSFIMHLFSMALLSIAVAASYAVIENAPAFNTGLRTESVFGDWRVPIRRAIYDKSEYHYQIGYGYLQGDAAALLFGDGKLPEPAVQQANVAKARRYMTASLAEAPGRAGAWTALSWSRLLSGDNDGAKQALLVSWSLAQFNAAEAAERLSLAEALGAPKNRDWLEIENVMAGIENDFNTLQMYDERYLRLFLEEFPEFMVFNTRERNTAN